MYDGSLLLLVCVTLCIGTREVGEGGGRLWAVDTMYVCKTSTVDGWGVTDW